LENRNITTHKRTIIFTEKHRKPSAVFVDANGNDEITQFVYKCRDFYLYSKPHQIKSITLFGETATRVTFLMQLNKDNIKYVCCAGHGNQQSLCGYTESGGEPYTSILELIEINREISKRKIFHFFACNTGVENGLGERLSNYGASFIGYNKSVIVGNIKGMEESLMKPDCSIAEYILSGYTVEEAFNWGKQQYEKVCNQIAPLVVNEASHNMKALVIHGDQEATIYELMN